MKVETQYRKAKGEEEEEDQEYLNEEFDTWFVNFHFFYLYFLAIY